MDSRSAQARLAVLWRGAVAGRRFAGVLGCLPVLLVCGVTMSDVAARGAATAPAATSTAPEMADADGWARRDRPGWSGGRAQRLRVARGHKRRVAFLRFPLPALPAGAVRQATLRVRTTAARRRAVVALRSVRPGAWREKGLTWRRRPRLGHVVDRAAHLRRGRWVSLDATRLVAAAGSGDVSMALTAAVGSSSFASREARRGRPRLIVRTTSPTPGLNPPSSPTGSPTTSSPGPATPTPTPTPAVVTIAGDIADDGSGDSDTAEVIRALDPDLVLTAGDNAYPDGALADYESWYAPTWGAFKARTRPVPGNHDYHTPDATGYFDYFNGAGKASGPAGERGKGYYSFDVGSWHLIALNNYVSQSAGSVQEQWLKNDLAAHTGQCTLAYWHEPRFTSGAEHGNSTEVAPFWNDLYAAGADVVINGHNHQYERFAPQDPSAKPDAARGIREFVVGTGGAGLYPFAAPQPNSEIRDATANGVLKLTLGQGSYRWNFVPAGGASFTDSGTGTCHNASAPSPPSAGKYALRGVFFRQSNGGFDVEVAHGFNLIDSVPSEVADLPAGVRGLTWVGDYDKTTCQFEQSDAQISSYVHAHIGDPKVGVWFISDEPWQGGHARCLNAPQQHKARSALIHSIDPKAKTLIVLDGNSGQESLDQIPDWVGTADYVGINAYMCWQGQACHYDWIDTIDANARAAHLPLWGVIQAHGEPDGQGQVMCVVDAAGKEQCGQTRLPTPAEIHQEFNHWRQTSMLNYLVFSWRWPDNAPSFWLENHPELQDQLAIEAAA